MYELLNDSVPVLDSSCKLEAALSVTLYPDKPISDWGLPISKVPWLGVIPSSVYIEDNDESLDTFTGVPDWSPIYINLRNYYQIILR